MVQLPWEMIEEILFRVPPKSLVRFRTVSKKWNSLFDNKAFLNNHKSSLRFVLRTKSKIYSVSINTEIVVRELALYIPSLESQRPITLVDCNDFLLCDMVNGAVVWNPWLKQTRVIKSQPGLHFEGIGYDDSNKRIKERSYKTIASTKTCWRIHDFATNAWDDRRSEFSSYDYFYYFLNLDQKCPTSSGKGVPLNGNIYWITFYEKTDRMYNIHQFDISSQSFLSLCKLPCRKNHLSDVLVLGVFKGDRLSLLKQCHVTKKIEIWVTENKINNSRYNYVVWMSFMKVSVPNLPDLVPVRADSQPSYFIEDKTLVMCCCDETGRVWIYVMEENKLISKTKIESVVDPWPLHCTYYPSYVPVPQGPRD